MKCSKAIVFRSEKELFRAIAFLVLLTLLSAPKLIFAQKAEYKVEILSEEGTFLPLDGNLVFNKQEVATIRKGKGLVLLPRSAQWIFDIKANLQTDGTILYQPIYKGWTINKEKNVIHVKLQKVRPVTLVITYPNSKPVKKATVVFKGPNNSDTLQLEDANNGLIKFIVPDHVNFFTDKSYAFLVDGVPATVTSEQNNIVRITAEYPQVAGKKSSIGTPTSEEARLMLIDHSSKQPLAHKKFQVGDQTLVTDENGILSVAITNDLDIKNYDIINQVVDEKAGVVKLFIKYNRHLTTEADPNLDAEMLSLESQLEALIKILGERNHLMEQTIEKIKLRINADRSFTKEQRERLNRQIQILENITNQNDIAYRKAHQEIKNILSQIGKKPLLTDTIMERELSMMNEKLKQVEQDRQRIMQEQRQSEEKSRRQLIAISSVAFLLLLLAMIFFLIGKNIKRQKEELARRMEEIKQQNEKIRQQNELLLTQQEEIARKNLRLKELNEEKNSLVDIVARDLKSSLSKVANVAQLLPVVGELNQDQRNYVDIIRKAALEGTRFIDDLLDINAIEQGQTAALSPEKISLAIFLPELLRSFRTQADRKNIRLHFQNNAEDGIIYTDREYLRRVVENLISNAIKFSPQGKDVYLKIRTLDEYCCISVKDEGPGLTEEDHKRLFKKFQRLSAKPTGGENSTGLGLAIAKLLVHRLGGSIAVSSIPNKGAEFTVMLPKTSLPAKADQEPSIQQPTLNFA